MQKLIVHQKILRDVFRLISLLFEKNKNNKRTGLALQVSERYIVIVIMYSFEIDIAVNYKVGTVFRSLKNI